MPNWTNQIVCVCVHGLEVFESVRTKLKLFWFSICKMLVNIIPYHMKNLFRIVPLEFSNSIENVDRNHWLESHFMWLNKLFNWTFSTKYSNIKQQFCELFEQIPKSKKIDLKLRYVNEFLVDFNFCVCVFFSVQNLANLKSEWKPQLAHSFFFCCYGICMIIMLELFARLCNALDLQRFRC